MNLNMNDEDDDSLYANEIEERLYFAVEAGDAVTLKNLMSEGYDPSYKFEGSNQLDKTLLHLACEKGHEECAKILLESGAKINAQDAWFQTPLMYSVCTERENMVELLIKHGAKLEARDRFSRGALHYAVMNETQDCMKALLDGGTDVDIRDDTGKSPLYHAIMQDCRLSVIRFLLGHNANVNIIEKRESRPLIVTCVLHSKTDLIEKVKLLLDAGADPNALDRYAHTALVSLVNKFFRQGAQVTEEHIQTCKLLLDYGCKVNLHCEVKYWYQFSGTALKMSADRGCPKLVKLLLDYGANPNIPDQKKVYPIHSAAFRGCLESVKLLLHYNSCLSSFAEMKFGTDDFRKVTPFNCALMRNHGEIAKLLYMAGCDMWLEHLWNSPNVPPILIEGEFSEWLQEALSQPMRLFLLVRLRLRVWLGQPFWVKVKTLPLPSQMKWALSLPECTAEAVG